LPAQVGHEDTERYDRILAAAIAVQAGKGWRPAGPTDFAGLLRSGRSTLRRGISPMDVPLTFRYLRAVTVPLERRAAHSSRGRRRTAGGPSTWGTGPRARRRPGPVGREDAATSSTRGGIDAAHRSRPRPRAIHLPPHPLAGGTVLAGSPATSRWRSPPGLWGSGPAGGLPAPGAGRVPRGPLRRTPRQTEGAMSRQTRKEPR
jgi:hypothetical protein